MSEDALTYLQADIEERLDVIIQAVQEIRRLLANHGPTNLHGNEIDYAPQFDEEPS